MSPGSHGAVLLLLGYLVVGCGVALALSRRGYPAATGVSALFAWPVLLPLVQSPPRPPAGPLAARIATTFAALGDALQDPAAGDLAFGDDLRGLQLALERADERLALVDRLLADTPDDPRVADGLASLRTARDRAASEIEGVLADVAQLRLQIGLVALAGQDLPVRERLRALLARARAFEEVAAFPEDCTT